MFKWEDHFSKDEIELIVIKTLTKPMGLDRIPWAFVRGAKTERFYKKLLTGSDSDYFNAIDVKYAYTYLKNGDGSNNLRKISSYEDNVSFWNEDGSLFHVIPVPSSLNGKNIKEINRDIRFGQIDYLEDAAEEIIDGASSLPYPADLPTVNYLVFNKLIPPYITTVEIYNQFRNSLMSLGDDINQLFFIYHEEIFDFKDRGLMDFENAVNNEIRPDVLKKLNKQVPPSDDFPNGALLKEAIIYQLTGVKGV